MSGAYLEPGAHNYVMYTGETMDIEDAVIDIAAFIVNIWHYEAPFDEWYMYDPLDPIGTDLYVMEQGKIYQIRVTQRCFWEMGEPTQPAETDFPWMWLFGSGVVLGAAFLFKSKKR